MNTNNHSTPTHYASANEGFSEAQQCAIREAIDILQSRFQGNEVLTSSQSVKTFCQLRLGTEPDEHFCCLFLDTQHRLIAFETLFNGTIDSASIYPRVVVRRTLELNAAAIIFAHNHPSGCITTSAADVAITKRLIEALELIDVRVLDHIIVSAAGTTSMREQGII